MNFKLVMLACQGYPATWNTLAQAVWKSCLAFMWAVLMERYNPDAPIGDYVQQCRHDGLHAIERRNQASRHHSQNVMDNMGPGTDTLTLSHVADQLATTDKYLMPPPPPVAPTPTPPPAPGGPGPHGMTRFWVPGYGWCWK